MKCHSEIDLSGLRCPLPVLKTKKALSSLRPGDILKVHTTDSDSEKDIPDFVALSGNRLLEQTQCENTLVFYIEKC